MKFLDNKILKATATGLLAVASTVATVLILKK
jgi:hypothetical protein